VRLDEVILQAEGDELRLRFHPQLTVLSGVDAGDRSAFADSLLAALTGGPERTALRYTDGAGTSVSVVGDGTGKVTSRHEDGSPAPLPIGTLAPDAAGLRSLMLLEADDIAVIDRRDRDHEPPELREARDMLEELTAELEAARGQEEAVAALQARLDALDEELRSARDGIARREYAMVLAHLEQLRSELAALQSTVDAVESDRNLVANAAQVRELAERWAAAKEHVAQLVADIGERPRLDAAERDLLASVPGEPPADLDDLVGALHQASSTRDALDHRLQDLSVSRLPAPSDPVVAELGVLDQAALWSAADRLVATGDAVQRVQMSLGGLELEEIQSATTLIDAIETAHADVDAAERAVDASKVPGLAGTSIGVAAGVAGVALSPFLLPVGLAGAAVAAAVGLVRPRARRAKALRAEAAALAEADATSYLGFHIRRVEATVDPQLRSVVESTVRDHRAAQEEWAAAAPGVPLERALALADEVRSYHQALRALGETAEEIDTLRQELERSAEPAVRAAYVALAAECEPYHLPDGALTDATQLPGLVQDQCDRGAGARAQALLANAEADEEKAVQRLDDLLLHLAFDSGPVDARVGWFQRSVEEAELREVARQRARPRTEVDGEIAQLEAAATALRQPEWGSVTAAEADAPDIPALEDRRASIAAELATARAEVDIDRLADRHAAVERRVTALEAKLGGPDGGADPGAIADIQQQLLTHLTRAGQAAPHGDPVPVLLDEVLARVPADRKWDLLDLLHRLSEKHQLVYLSDDAFVAAWARQRALDGTVTLLEPVPESS
jgi:hypothetical protein